MKEFFRKTYYVTWFAGKLFFAGAQRRRQGRTKLWAKQIAQSIYRYQYVKDTYKKNQKKQKLIGGKKF